MRFFQHKISLVVLVLMSFIISSCENDDDNGGSQVTLNALFVSDVNLRTITFTNISSGAESYSWDFGNGDTSTLVHPSVTYSENGTYTVALTAFDGNGNSSTFEKAFIIDALICDDEMAENIDPANGNLNWTFLTTNGDATFDAFGDIGGAIVDNPVLGGINNSCNVYKYEKLAGCQTWSGTGIALASSIDFSATSNKTFKMKVLAENQLTDVTLRLEFMPFPNTEPSQERVASITQLGEWQELTFDFTDVPSGTFKSIIVYFERNAPCDGDVYYFDDIIQQ